MNLFVLGAGGFVGSAFVRVAERRRLKITAITRDNYGELRGRSCDLLINAAGNSRKFLAERDPLAEFEASVASVLRSLVDFPCQRYVYLSTVDVYGRVDAPRFNRETARIEPGRLSRYGLHKFLAEQLVSRYAPRWLIIRLGGMVGEGLGKNSVFDILHGKPLSVHTDSCYQYLSTDAVAGIVLSLIWRQPSNDVFNVCGDGCVPLREIASWVPEYELHYLTENPRREHYEVSIAKLGSLLRVPKTRTTVRRFIRRQGRS